METTTIFRIILPVLIIVFVLHRGYYIKKHTRPEDDTLKKREEGTASKLASLLGMIGLLATLVFVINPGWLAWANLPLPIWLRLASPIFAVAGIALLQWAQNSLGKSWSDTPRMMREQKLITSGPYQFIRHPIYTAFILILGSTLFISANWLIGMSWIGMTLLEIFSRINFEENLMIEYFGDQYREYMKNTGRLLPKLI